MTRRAAAALCLMLALPLVMTSRLLAHPGHEHKIMGTVTMAAADHVMLKTKDGKDVTIAVTADTKILRGKEPVKAAEIQAGSRVVVTAVTENEKMKAKTIQVGAVTPAK
jgi:hypothetical protein